MIKYCYLFRGEVQILTGGGVAARLLGCLATGWALLSPQAIFG